jgi:protein phosphatase
MFGIFDGHVSEKCSAFVAQQFPQAVQALNKIPMADADVQKMALKVDKEWGELQVDGGSTGTWVIVHQEGTKYKLQVGNVGDSRVLVGRRGGVLEAMTTDHKPEQPAERRRIEECGGHVENNRVDGSLAVSRAFGDADYKRTAPLSDQLKQKVIALADLTHTEIQANTEEFILLCCDGVFEGDFSNAQIIEFAAQELAKTDDLATVCSLVCEEALHRGSKDNISCMIVKLNDGTAFAAKYKDEECLPGPFLCPDQRNFVTAYKKMLDMGHMTLPQALQFRYHYIRTQLPILKEKYKNIRPEELSAAEVRAILQPPMGTPAQRQAWNETSRPMQLQQIATRRTRGEALPNFVLDMQTELEMYGNGPEPGTPAEQLQWFDDWATKQCSAQPVASATGGIAGGPQGEMLQRLVALQQQLGLPLPMLLNLLARDSGRDGP